LYQASEKIPRLIGISIKMFKRHETRFSRWNPTWQKFGKTKGNERYVDLTDLEECPAIGFCLQTSASIEPYARAYREVLFFCH
jgi:hypothetical protein